MRTSMGFLIQYFGLAVTRIANDKDGHMRKFTIFILCALLLFSCSAAAFAAEGESGGAEESISASVGALLDTENHNAYISGYEGGLFKPGKQVTRAETAKMFYNLLKVKPEEVVAFSDVGKNQWYYKEVGALAHLGAIRGKTADTFAPNDNIRRSEFVAIAARFSTLMQGANPFTDVDSGKWYYPYVISASQYGWIGGYEDGTFQPDKPITRAEAVKVINAMLGRTGDANVADFDDVTSFSDVGTGHWAYAAITEAATSHTYRREGGAEKWDVPENDEHSWQQTDTGAWRYYNETKGTYASGFQYIDGLTYYFAPESGELQTGWTEINGLHYLLPEKDDPAFTMPVTDYLTLVNKTDANRDDEDIRYIVVHYTAVPDDTALGECESFYDTYRGASAHYFVDEFGIYRCVHDKDIAWHVGNSYYHHDDARNDNSVGIEMCTKKADASNVKNPYDSDWYFHEDTKNNTVDLIRCLMKQYGVPVESLIRHSDVSQKACPAPFINSAAEWRDFLRRVTNYEVDYDGRYEARIMEDNVPVYSGPDSTYEKTGTLQRDEVVTVYEERVTTQQTSGRWVRIGDDRWVNLTKTSRLPAEA